MILIFLDFLSGMEWLCQPDRNVEPKKPFVSDNEKAGSRYFHLKSGSFLFWFISVKRGCHALWLKAPGGEILILNFSR